MMLARLLGSGAATGSTVTFTDASHIAPWAQAGVASASSAGLVAGYPDGTFQPADTTTRAQAAQVIFKYLHRAGRL